MSTTIRLLGRPTIEVEGAPVRNLRGHKSWGMLAYLVINERPPSRLQLAGLLFADAADPLGALRWNLAELRRAIGSTAVIGDDPVRIELSDSVRVDVIELAGGKGVLIDDPPGELLEALSFDTCPGFETWLRVARLQLGSRVEALLARDIRALIAAGSLEIAIEALARLVALNPLNERYQSLLVKCLADSGRQAEAERQLASATHLLRAELGAEPSFSLRHAITKPSIESTKSASAVVAAKIDAGRSAMAAGATDAAVHCLRAAVADAESARDGLLMARALTTLGSSLLRIGTSFDEAEAVLHRGLLVACAAGDRPSTIVAHRELGFLHIQSGYHGEGDRNLVSAAELATGDDVQLASIQGIRAMSLADQAHYAESIGCLDESIKRAVACDRPRKRAWSLAMLGRVHLSLGDLDLAREELRIAMQIGRAERWSAFMPWPEALSAEVDLLDGCFDDSAMKLDHARALADQIDDHGLTAFAERGLARLAEERGDVADAFARSEAAQRHAFQDARTYVWIQVQVCAIRAELYLDHGTSAHSAEVAAAAIAQWIDIAARCGLRESVVLAQRAAARAGALGASEAAAALAANIDNPMLQ